MGPNKRQNRETTHRDRREDTEDGGRDWLHAAPNQGTARIVNNQKLRKGHRKDSPFESPEGNSPAAH